MKKIKKETGGWKCILCPKIRIFSVIEVFLQAKTNYRLNTIPMKMCTEIEKYAKINIEPQRTSNIQNEFEQIKQSWWHHTFLFQNILQISNDLNNWLHGRCIYQYETE